MGNSSGRPIQTKFVANSQIVTSSAKVTTTAASPFQLTNPFPVGDLIYQDLNLRISGNVDLATGGGTAVVDGGLQFIRALYLSTPQHNMIVEGVDGILLSDMQTCENHKDPRKVDISSTAVGDDGTVAAQFEYYLKLPFKDLRGFDAQDLGLDVLRSGQPLLQLNTGVYTDFVAGGAAADAVEVYTMESHLRLDPGPIDPASEAPGGDVALMPYRGVLKVPISSTVAQYQIFLAFGDRIIKRLYITQRNGSTLARLANTVIGAADTDRVSLKINSNFPWYDRVEWNALQAQNQNDYQLTGMPTGVAVMDFVQEVLGGSGNGIKGGISGAKLADALSVLSKNQGTLELDADVTTSTNSQIWIGYDAAKPLPAGAQRPTPPAKV